MYEKLKECEIEFMEHWYDPIALKENLFPENIKASHTWIDEDVKLIRIRPYQFAWQNYSIMYSYDSKLTPKENFDKIKGAGTCYNIGARNTGKSFDFIQMDIPVTLIQYPGDESCCGSATDGFLKKVLNPVTNIVREHPFFEIYRKAGKNQGITSSNGVEIQTAHGHTFYGRNEKIDSPEPGTKFHGLHYKILYYEESHYMTEKGEEKRIDSGSSLGVIERFSGIPDLRIGSPLGKILDDPKNKRYICRYPQYVREDWDANRKQDMIDKYKGESSLAYKLNVIGEPIKGAEGFWDIERIKKKCLNKSQRIKRFDIDKKKFKEFEKHLIIDRLPAEQIYVCADIGKGGTPSELIIIFYSNNTYKLVYNISLHKLTSREQAQIFAHLYGILGGAFIALDATTDYGIIEYLEKDFPNIDNDHLLSVDLRKKIQVGFETDSKGRAKRNQQGKIITKEAIAIDWAMQELEHLFYEGKIQIPMDNKFFKEFSGFAVLQTGLRRSYSSVTTDDYHQAFQIFAICRFFNEQQILKNKKNNKNCLGYM